MDMQETYPHGILNMTQHLATDSQKEAGVFDFRPEKREDLCRRLTFDALPNVGTLVVRAQHIADMIPPGVEAVMIGGAGWFLPFLSRAIVRRSYVLGYKIDMLMAFSQRKVVERVMEDGAVSKTAIFEHIGFIPYSSSIQMAPSFKKIDRNVTVELHNGVL